MTISDIINCYSNSWTVVIKLEEDSSLFLTQNKIILYKANKVLAHNKIVIKIHSKVKVIKIRRKVIVIKIRGKVKIINILMRVILIGTN